MEKKVRASLVAVILTLSASATVHAATYQWRDNRGGIHFTDNADTIPDRYLNGAKELPSIRGEKKSQPKGTASTVNPEVVGTPAAPVAAPAAAPAATPPKDAGGGKEAKRPDGREMLKQELKSLQEGLSKKKEDLAKLHHKYVVRKGRTPSEKELKEFEEKKTKKKITTFHDVKENPFINKNSLSAVGPARAAYYKKLEEVQGDEERVRQLEKELQAIQ